MAEDYISSTKLPIQPVYPKFLVRKINASSICVLFSIFIISLLHHHHHLLRLPISWWVFHQPPAGGTTNVSTRATPARAAAHPGPGAQWPTSFRPSGRRCSAASGCSTGTEKPGFLVIKIEQELISGTSIEIGVLELVKNLYWSWNWPIIWLYAGMNTAYLPLYNWNIDL